MPRARTNQRRTRKAPAAKAASSSPEPLRCFSCGCSSTKRAVQWRLAAGARFCNRCGYKKQAQWRAVEEWVADPANAWFFEPRQAEKKEEEVPGRTTVV